MLPLSARATPSVDVSMAVVGTRTLALDSCPHHKQSLMLPTFLFSSHHSCIWGSFLDSYHWKGLGWQVGKTASVKEEKRLLFIKGR